jgi:hypothetical protein
MLKKRSSKHFTERLGRPASYFGDEARSFCTRQALGAGSVVDRACMGVADQNSGCAFESRLRFRVIK